MSLVGFLAIVESYDPEDKEIATIIPEPGTFEAFYPRETNGKLNSVSRASHNHGSFFQHRNPGNFAIAISISLKKKISHTLSITL